MAAAPGLRRPRSLFSAAGAELLRAARRGGCRPLDRAGVAVWQAVEAFELFTGRAPDAQRNGAAPSPSGFVTAIPLEEWQSWQGFNGCGPV
ncbi:MAG: hypothetical protein ACHP7M_01955 [Burkholderiales bacterium]